MKISPFKLERYFAKYEFNAPYLLSSSDCESFSIKELLQFDEKDNIKEAFQNLRLGYTESEGNPELREEISHLYNKILPENILCFSGAQEGIMVFMNSLLSKGDHIIVQYPAYQSLYEIARSIECEVSEWFLEDNKENQQWQISIENLRKSIKNNTKAIIINFPHNPTGALIKQHEFNAIIEIAKEHDLYIFSDEVYRFLEFDESTRLPAVCDLYPKSCSLGVMSKAFGLAGLRIGWIATKNNDILNKMKAMKDYTTICNSAPSEFLAKLALQHKEKILERNLEIIQKNLSLLDHFFATFSDLFEWNPPEAGSVALVKLKNNEDIDKFCIDVVESAGVLLLPSTLFEFGNNYFRIGFGRKNLPEALIQFESYIQDRYYPKNL
ncbi:MAG: aminotransferase class I/II-fold pyridoxal phosphate-dependent enzyme [Promethearchaeota archaeon]